MCVSLQCYNPYDGNCVSTQGEGALEGTQCDIGKVCLGYKCVSSPLSNNETRCAYDDQAIINGTDTGIALPYSIMSCDAYLDYYYKNINSSTFDCRNSDIKKKCCKSCESKKFNDLFNF